MTAPETSSPKRVMVFSHPRTVSSLFTYLFRDNGNNLNNENFYFFFSPYFFGPERPSKDRVFTDKVPFDPPGSDPYVIHKDDTYQKAWDTMRENIEKGEKEGKTFFHKEHLLFYAKTEVIAKHFPREQAEKLLAQIQPSPVIVNKWEEQEISKYPKRDGETECPAVIPESFLRTISPCIMIRHPALVFPSFYRLSRKQHGTDVDDVWAPMDFSLKHLRLMFEWYKSIGAGDGWPIVLDAEELVKNTATVVKKFKEQTGLDIKERYEWGQRIPGECQRDNYAGILFNSKGVIDDPRYKKPIVIEEEREKWKEEWGEEVANKLAQYATEALPDYEYLKQFRLH